VAKFAELADVSTSKVTRDLHTWKACADQGLVPDATTLKPGDPNTWDPAVHTPEKWALISGAENTRGTAKTKQAEKSALVRYSGNSKQPLTSLTASISELSKANSYDLDSSLDEESFGELTTALTVCSEEVSKFIVGLMDRINYGEERLA
jgi:hypothetical protein